MFRGAALGAALGRRANALAPMLARRTGVPWPCIQPRATVSSTTAPAAGPVAGPAAADVWDDAAVAARAPAVAVVHTKALQHNARVLMRAAADLGAKVMAVVKADGYGHGAVQVARAHAAVGVEAFAVATIPEAVALRRGGIRGTVLVLGAPLPGDIAVLARFDLETVVCSPSVARRVMEEAAALPPGTPPLRYHLYIETGMTRLGLLPDEVEQTLALLQSSGRPAAGPATMHMVGVCIGTRADQVPRV